MGRTIVAFCDAVHKFMPMDVTPTASTVQLATESVPEQSLLEHTCAAMMSYISTANSKPADNLGAGSGKFTPEQQTAYIESLKAQSQAKDQTTRSLLTSAGSNGSGGSGGRGRQGGCGRGRCRAPGNGEPEVDNVDAGIFPEIFVAEMQSLICHQLAAEYALDLDCNSVLRPHLWSSQCRLSPCLLMFLNLCLILLTTTPLLPSSILRNLSHQSTRIQKVRHRQGVHFQRRSSDCLVVFPFCFRWWC